mmetsp:Transcript_44927/g.104940  ORF Transcript_44927/g.104940 Transcript_44927/m.104940 type:complete len:306 (-) Transcript_44927:923-1840(-)
MPSHQRDVDAHEFVECCPLQRARAAHHLEHASRDAHVGAHPLAARLHHKDVRVRRGARMQLAERDDGAVEVSGADRANVLDSGAHADALWKVHLSRPFHRLPYVLSRRSLVARCATRAKRKRPQPAGQRRVWQKLAGEGGGDMFESAHHAHVVPLLLEPGQQAACRVSSPERCKVNRCRREQAAGSSGLHALTQRARKQWGALLPTEDAHQREIRRRRRVSTLLHCREDGHRVLDGSVCDHRVVQQRLHWFDGQLNTRGTHHFDGGGGCPQIAHAYEGSERGIGGRRAPGHAQPWTAHQVAEPLP